ncbi:hypothetical protein [Clostridium scatologenes]|nr:hypothetical protein [Clostridium scatologenes]
MKGWCNLMAVDVKNMSDEEMKEKLLEIKIENLKNIEAKKQLKLTKLKKIKQDKTVNRFS